MHKYCYSEKHGRLCQCPDKCDQNHVCLECKKPISDCEWVTCWGGCGECFNKSLDEYQKQSNQAGIV